MVGEMMSASGTAKQDLMGNDTGEEFVVERIVSHRFRNGRKEYLLAWKGYPEEENTWVKHTNKASVDTFALRLFRNLTKTSIVPT